MGEILRIFKSNGTNRMAVKHHFSYLSITISDKDLNRPAKHS